MGVTDGPEDPVAVDVATVTAQFGAALHEAGVPAGPGRCERFARAVSVMRPGTLRELHACGLATLVSGPEQIEIYDRIFAAASLIARDRPGVFVRPLGPIIVINVILNLILIPPYGANGAAVTALVSSALLAVVSMVQVAVSPSGALSGRLVVALMP